MNGMFSLVWAEDKVDLHFSERPKLKNFGDSVEEIVRRDRVEQREGYCIIRNKKMTKKLEGLCSPSVGVQLGVLYALSFAHLLCQPCLMVPIKQKQHNNDGSGVLFDH